jgi:hypothetical protein
MAGFELTLYGRIWVTPEGRITIGADMAQNYSQNQMIEGCLLDHRHVECPASFVPVEVRQTGMRGAIYGTREEAYSRADREPAAAG